MVSISLSEISISAIGIDGINAITDTAPLSVSTLWISFAVIVCMPGVVNFTQAAAFPDFSNVLFISKVVESVITCTNVSESVSINGIYSFLISISNFSMVPVGCKSADAEMLISPFATGRSGMVNVVGCAHVGPGGEPIGQGRSFIAIVSSENLLLAGSSTD